MMAQQKGDVQQKAPPKATVTKQAPDSIDHMVTAIMKRESVPGMTLMVVRNGKMLKATSYGVANLEHKIPTKFSTVYELASISKPITAMAIMQLVEQGKVSLDSSIARYIYGVPASHASILVRHLLSHSSGIPQLHINFNKLYYPSPLRYTVKEQLEDLFKLELKFQPGQGYQYSNGGYFLLGQIISSTSGMSFENYIQKNILDKALMSHTKFQNADSIVFNRAQTYTKRNGKLVRFTLEATQALDANSFGELISTTGDLLQLNMALLDGKIISMASLELMMTPEAYKNKKALDPSNPSEIGLGWFVRDVNGKKCVEHIGHTGGAVVNCPEQKFSLVLLSNLSQGYDMFGDKGYDVKKLALEIAARYIQ
jgi:CubicO group peptidase (beta-lactamase class C family)